MYIDKNKSHTYSIKWIETKSEKKEDIYRKTIYTIFPETVIDEFQNDNSFSEGILIIEKERL